MQMVIWLGGTLTLIGLFLIVTVMRRAFWLRKAGLSEEQTRAELAKLVPRNLAALLLSFLGLGVVIVGVLLSR